MKNIFNGKILKYVTCLMIIVQGILFSLLATFYMGESYFNKLRIYPNSALYIELKTIPEENTEMTYRFLDDYARQNGLFYIRKDLLIDDMGATIGITLSVDGDIESNRDELNLDFLGENIISTSKLDKLLTSDNDDATLGLGKSSLNSIGDIPSFIMGNKVLVKKLETTVKETKTINGQYKIVGLNKDKEAEFLEGLSQVSGVDSSVFFDGKSGYIIDHGFGEMVIVGTFVFSSLVLLALLIVITIKNLPNLGKLILQGWSRKHFALKLYQPFLYTALFSVPLFIGYGIIFTGFTFKSLIFFSLMVGLGLINFLIIGILLLISSFFIFLISPINAIRERMPRKKYMGIAVFVYCLFNVCLIAICSYIDGPSREVEKNIEIKQSWDRVSDYKILKDISVGNDQASFNRQSKEFFRDFYNWYRSIADKDGVYIANTAFTSKDDLENYKANHVYEIVPNEEFWLLTASPNYLNKIGISMDDSLVEDAKEGLRTYLIPDNKSDEEIALLKEMLIEQDTKSIRPDDIDTTFNDNKEFNFVKYPYDEEIFSYSTDSSKDLMIKNPIILVLTPENMIYRESESLSAIGLENSFIKLDDKADKYLDPSYLTKFNLGDNNIEFATISLFVDGIVRNLWVTIKIFLGFLLSLTFIVIILLITIVTIFQDAYKERISVKKFLGYSNFHIYKIPILLVIFVITIDIASVIILRSKVGILLMTIIALAQVIIFYMAMVSNQMKKLNLFLKA